MSARILIGAAAALSVAMGAQGAVYAPEVKTALDALGLREEVVVVRVPTSDGDLEPLFLARGLNIQPTYFRGGEQHCMDKLGVVVACSDESGDPAVAQAIEFDDVTAVEPIAASLPDWAGTPLPAVRDGAEIWITVPAPRPLPGTGPSLPVVSLGSARWYLAGAVIAAVAVGGAVAWRRKG